MKKPLVSIITTSYNQVNYLKYTLESVLNQNYPKIEYIVIDGGSSDGSVELLKSYGKKIRWISEKDKGQSNGLNKGFKRAKGDIIGWINSDDTYEPGAVKKAAEYFDKHPDVDLIYSDCNIILKERAHIGILFFKDSDLRRYKLFLDEIKNKFDKKNLKTENLFSDCVPFSTRPKIQKGNVYLVGDAAGQVKATSGGGIYYGCKSAWLAGKTIETRDYEKKWRKEIGNELGKHSFAREFINKLNPTTTNLVLNSVSFLGLGDLLNKYDMETISSVFKI